MGQAESLFAQPKPTWHDVDGTRTATRGAAHLHDGDSQYRDGMTLYTSIVDYRRQYDDGSRPMFGTRPIDQATGEAGDYEWITYAQFLDQVADMSAAMVHALGLKRQEPIGIFAKNRYEWVLVEHGANRMAYALVPLYDTLGPDAIPFIINQTELRVLFVAAAQLPTLLKTLEHCPTVKTIVQFEDVDETHKQQAQARGVELKGLREILAIGKAKPVDADPPLPSDVATICYTSGTTGNPKGAVLSHANLTCVAINSIHVAGVVETDVHLSFLPLAHVLERILQYVHLAAGGSIGFYQGEVAKLIDDLAALRPTTLTAVPRVFNRIYDKVSAGVEKAGGLKKALFDQALASKQAYLADGYVTHALWDRLVFQKLRDMIGGRVRLLVTGSAPLTQDCRDFLQIAFSCPVIEGYGLTETCGVSALSTPVFPSGTHVGGPIPGVEMCLADVPDMNYTSNDTPCPRGEICIRGPSLFQGYFKDPERTAEVIDEDGWFHTGDIGKWNPDGTMTIIDRKKNIFKLSQGEYIAPEKIENIYMKSSLVAQMLVHGYSTENYVVGVVVPEREAVVEWATENIPDFDASESAIDALMTSDELQKAIATDLEAIAVQFGLFRFERVQKIYLESELWSVENHMITPTFKLKRQQLVERYQTQINAMYKHKK